MREANGSALSTTNALLAPGVAARFTVHPQLMPLAAAVPRATVAAQRRAQVGHCLNTASKASAKPQHLPPRRPRALVPSWRPCGSPGARNAKIAEIVEVEDPSALVIHVGLHEVRGRRAAMCFWW